MNAADALRWALHALSGVALALSISLVAVGTRDALRGRPAPQLPAPDADTASEAGEAPVTGTGNEYESIAQRGLFEPLRGRAAVPEALPARETTLQLELLGTIYSSGAPERSLAVVRDLDTRETHVLCVGMSIGPAQVLEIHSRALLLSHDGNTERLALRPLPSTEVAGDESAASEDGAAAAAGEEPGFAGSDAAAAPEPNVPPPDAFDAAALAAEGRPPQIDHEAALRALSQQVRFVPQFSESGGLRGVQLSGLDPSGSLWRAGFREGDVIVSVDGLPFEAPGALETLRSLPLDSGLQVDLERAGTPLHIAIGADALQF